MAFKVTKHRNWDISAGTYRAVCEGAFEMERESSQVRIVFRIPSLSSQLTDALIGRTYNEGDTRLLDDLERWLGRKCVEGLIRPDRTLDLARLKGISAYVRAEHRTSGAHNKPFVELVEYWAIPMEGEDAAIAA